VRHHIKGLREVEKDGVDLARIVDVFGKIINSCYPLCLAGSAFAKTVLLPATQFLQRQILLVRQDAVVLKMLHDAAM